VFNKYYQDELIYLRQLGREYAHAYPETAKLLADNGTDPDVERMLEGTAFITGRLRQKLDDELPELTHALIETFWPHYLQPIPSLATVQFEHSRQTDKEPKHIPRGTAVDSIPVDGTRCRFRTAYDVMLSPMRITGVTLRTHAPTSLTIKFRCHEGVKVGQLKLDRLRLHCSGLQAIASALHVCLTRYCTSASLVSGERRIALPPHGFTCGGFAPEDALFGRPNAAFSGFAFLHEYFAFPEKFLYVDVAGMSALAGFASADEFSLECMLARVPTNMPQLSDNNLLLNCTPVVNEFPHGGSPIRIEPERREYKVIASGTNSEHYEILSLTSVLGTMQGNSKPRTFLPMYHQQRTGEPVGSYLMRRRPALVGSGSDIYLSAQNALADETLSIEVTCSNRRLPQALGPGDINLPTDQCPSGVRFKNLAKPTIPLSPPLGSTLEWQLLGHLSLNYRTLAQPEVLRSLLDLYNLRAQSDQQARQAHRRLLDAIASMKLSPTTIVSGGIPMRGALVELVLKDDQFDSEGDMHLFATLLDEVFSQYVGLNSFSQLLVRGAGNGDVHRRAPRLGRRRLL
jgi:type VI secretion system protein ImpG